VVGPQVVMDAPVPLAADIVPAQVVGRAVSHFASVPVCSTVCEPDVAEPTLADVERAYPRWHC
jgi:hypothetical protein